ncbi:MAG: hypothetical protein Q7R44_01055 [bacterium]|nr:hypothetical protein [bacterium]
MTFVEGPHSEERYPLFKTILAHSEFDYRRFTAEKKRRQMATLEDEYGEILVQITLGVRWLDKNPDSEGVVVAKLEAGYLTREEAFAVYSEERVKALSTWGPDAAKKMTSFLAEIEKII